MSMLFKRLRIIDDIIVIARKEIDKQMVIFNEDDFDAFNYLKFDKNFTIEVIKNKVTSILGPNGVGKSSIYKYLKQKHPEYGFIDYEEVKDSIKARDNSIKIAASIEVLNSKTKERDELLKNADSKALLKEKFGISNVQKSNDISNHFNELRMNSKKNLEHFDGKKVEKLIKLNGNLQDMFSKYGSRIINQTIEETKINDFKESIKRKYLEIIDKYIEDDEDICPVCNSKCDQPIKEIIKKKLAEIEESNNIIVNDYLAQDNGLTPEIIIERINELKEFITKEKITIQDLEDYLVCGGDLERAEFLVSARDKLIELDKEIEKMELKKEEFYNNIKEMRDSIEEVFNNQLKVTNDNIRFNDESKELEITLERSIETYSTGEINLITFIISLFEFIGSDKNILIIDDPLSSYDIPNQYKIMYEITSINQNNNYILLFTHNIDCINISNSQNSGSYIYISMDKVGDILYLNPFIYSLQQSGFNISYILNNIEDNYKYKKYLQLLCYKDSWTVDAEEHKLFHYDSHYITCINGESYDNDELIKIIDDLNVNSLNNETCVVNSANKVIYLASLRVWIEKKFTENTDDKEGLVNIEQFSNKVRFMFDGNHWTGSNKLTRRYLMSKKVMLNQNDHVKSQKEPFYFALSLSLDDVIYEIIDIKKHFVYE